MINSNTLRCSSCGTKITTRVAIGWGELQEHAFPCRSCGVEIRVILDIDQKNVAYSYRTPKNASWVDYDSQAEAITFDVDFLVPREGMFFSPFMSATQNFKDLQEYQKYKCIEMMRRQYRNELWSAIERLIVHFESNNYELFDKEANKIGYNLREYPTRKCFLGKLFEDFFANFTVIEDTARGRVKQRITLAKSISVSLFKTLNDKFKNTDRINTLWKQIIEIRRLFLKFYPSFAPIIQLFYWEEAKREINNYALCEKKFEDFKQLYINCFETICRLSVIAVGIECIIHYSSLEIPVGEKYMSLWEFEKMANGNKPNILKRFPIADLFIPFIDTKLRNGIGHHSAHYEVQTDQVVYYEFKGKNKIERRIDYTLFCYFMVRSFSALENGALYQWAVYMG